MADVGTATTIAFATSSFSAELLSLNGNDISRDDIDITHMGSTVFKEFMPGDLQDGGMIEIHSEDTCNNPEVEIDILGDPIEVISSNDLGDFNLFTLGTDPKVEVTVEVQSEN